MPTWRICKVAAFAAAVSVAAAAHASAQDGYGPASAGSAKEVNAIHRMSFDQTAPLLETGFRHLYDLDFDGARKDFANYQGLCPDDPWGKAAEAASYLFEEFNNKGVLTSEFFLNDSKFLGGIEGSAAENRNMAFLNAIHQARKLARKRVKSAPHDVQGLLVLTIADGLESAYEALVEKKHFAAIKLMWHAEREANATLAADVSAQDAYVALGITNYVIGSLPAYKKAFLWMGGVHGDRGRGVAQMQLAAEHGQYLRPFAEIMLALAYEREGQADRALQWLTKLTTEFPNNTVFSHELELLERQGEGKRKS
jgi:hypothetical protein